MTKKQIRELINALIAIEEIQEGVKEYSDYNNEVNKQLKSELQEVLSKADQVIHRYYTSINIITKLMVDIANMQEKKHYKALDEVMNKHMDEINKAYAMLGQLPDIWPEVFERNDIDGE